MKTMNSMKTETSCCKLRSVEDLRAVSKSCKHILTLFSGGLDSSYILELLKDSPARVTALAIDLGDGIDVSNLELITERYGFDLTITDAKQKFVDNALVPAIRSQAYYLGDYPVSSSLSRPIIVQCAVELAQSLGCDAIVHSANQSQNSLRRINGAIRSSGFSGYHGSPYEYTAVSRKEKIQSLFVSGLVGFKSRQISGDSNLWCREFESGALDDPESIDISPSLFEWSVWNPELHVSGNRLKIGFQNGLPVSLNDKPLELVDMIQQLNLSVGAYEIGRYVGFDHLEEDEKVLEVREAPAATVLLQAYKLLETAVLPTDVLKAKMIHNDMWTQEAVEGRWGSVLQQSSYAFIESTAKAVSGEICLNLSRGTFLPAGIVADRPRYIRDRDSWESKTAKLRSERSLESRSEPVNNVSESLIDG